MGRGHGIASTLEPERIVRLEPGAVVLLDQRCLPEKEVELRLQSAAEVASAIRSLAVRGAPAIGVAAAYGYAVAAERGEDLDEAYEVLASARVQPAAKDRILREVFEGRASSLVLRCLRVLNRHGRLGLLTSVTTQARATLDRRNNRKPVTVRSAIALDEGQQSALRDRLASMIGATPVITLEVDPSLIGGLVVQVGDEVYDASVRTRLEAIRGRLIERKTHEIQSRRDHFSYPA